MQHKGYLGAVEFDADDRMFYGRVIGLADVIGFEGSSVDELEASFRRAVDGYLARCEELGRLPQKTYSGTIYIRTDPELHQQVGRAAALANQSINHWAQQAMVHELERVGKRRRSEVQAG
jgi:predicted HicB family RNase H-like nuclease